MIGKTGVLLVNLGTPDDPGRGAVYRYLKQFLTDWRVIDYPWLPRNLLVRGIIAPFRSGSSAKLYQRLWTEEGSPLKVYGYKLEEELQSKLGDDYHVVLAMRYQSPSVPDGLERLRASNVSRIIVLPLFPQYASATTGSVHQEVMDVVRHWQSIPDMSFINSYPTDAGVIEAFAANAREFDLKNYDHFVFSFHGVPQRQLTKACTNNHCLKVAGCCNQLSEKNQFCYSAQCHSTAYTLAESLDIHKEKMTVAFQSRLGPEAWTQPYTSEVLKSLLEEGKKKVLVFSPAFVSDCLETTIEIGYEYKEEFIEDGGEVLDLVPSLNDHPRWIDSLKNMVLSRSIKS